MRQVAKSGGRLVGWVVALGLAAACTSVHDDPFVNPPAPCIDPMHDLIQSTSGQLQVPPTHTADLVAQPPQRVAGQALAMQDGKLYAVDSDNGTLVLIDAATLKVLAKVAVGPRPERVVVAPDGTAYVSVRQGGYVAKVTWAGNQSQLTQLKTGVEPNGLALSADGQTLYVGEMGPRQLRKMDLKQGSETTAPLPERPLAVAVSGDSVSVTLDGGTWVEIDGLTMQVVVDKRRFNGGSLANACNTADDAAVAVHRATALAVNPHNGTVAAGHVIANPGTSEGFVARAELAQSGKVQTEDCAHFAPPSGGYGGSSASNGGLNQQACPPVRPVEPALTTLGANASQPVRQPHLDTANRAFAAHFDQPSAMAFHPTMRAVLVAFAGTDNVLLLHDGGDPTKAFGQTARAPEFGEIHTGMAPLALVVAPDGSKAYVLNSQSFSVGEINLQPMVSAAGSALAKPLDLFMGKTVAIGQDPLPVEARLGRRVFSFAANDRLSGEGKFACATCHFEGGDDKQVWFITDGPRQTPALAGRLANTAPFNWKGTQNELQNNMKDTVHRMGGQGLTKDELVSLEKFLQVGLREPVNPYRGTTLNAAQARGKALFDDPKVACASCHNTLTSTDGALHDVGTANAADDVSMPGKSVAMRRSFNTPSLHNLFATAPYLHDGSAKTLREALLLTQTTMGRTDHLSDAQRDDLVAYLLTL